MVKQYNYVTELVNISNISVGDTVIHNGLMSTVSKSNIKNDLFIGKSIFGDSYNSGNKLVSKVIFIKA